MSSIDQAEFHFDPKFGVVVGLLVAITVFGVALDLRWENFRRLLASPRALLVGLVAQLVVLPGLAFVIIRLMVDVPSAGLGLLLVTCCPGGAFSNFLTSIARGDVATSVGLTAINTATCVVTTPLFFGFWASLSPHTAGLLEGVGIDPRQLVAMFALTIGVPVGAGMWLHARRPALAARIRPWVRRLSFVVFALVIVTGTTLNIRLMLRYARVALLPTVLCCTGATALGWVASRLTRLSPADRRAVTIEVGGQNVGMAIGMAVVFFPALPGVAVMGAVWGAVQVFAHVPLVLIWSRIPLETPAA